MVERHMRGWGVASGVAIGPIYLWRPAEAQRGHWAPGTPADELARFEQAVAASLQALERLTAKVDGEAQAMIDSHALLLTDPALHNVVRAAIASGKSAEAALDEAVEQFASALDLLSDPYLRERSTDVRAVGRRLVSALSGATAMPALEHPCVVVAHDLAPTDTLSLNPQMLLGIITEQGGPTSHTAILARTWGIPAVAGVGQLLQQAAEVQLVALDGETGDVVLNPTVATADAYRSRTPQRPNRDEQQGVRASRVQCRGADGPRVELAANAGAPHEVAHALSLGAEAIGLFRTEFLFMGRHSAPSEEEQYRVYVNVLHQAQGRRVIMRTLDIGADKPIPYLSSAPEPNPFLGCRGLRLCFQHPNLFQQQLRALLRASQHGRLAILFPLVADLPDLQRAKDALHEARRSLAAEGQMCGQEVEVGAMIEVPSAALTAERLAAEVDFFSIGTNDLTQYTLAVDRGNPLMATYYQPYHPAVLGLIHVAVCAAHGQGRWVSICGEMAGDPAGALLLLGLRVDELSMAAHSLSRIRSLLATAPYAELQALAQRALSLGSAHEVLALLRPFLDGERDACKSNMSER